MSENLPQHPLKGNLSYATARVLICDRDRVLKLSVPHSVRAALQVLPLFPSFTGNQFREKRNSHLGRWRVAWPAWRGGVERKSHPGRGGAELGAQG